MNSLKEVLPAIIGLVVVALLILVFRAIRSAVRREQEKNAVNYQELWQELCTRLSDAATTNGLRPYIDEREDSFGGEVRVLREFNGQSEKVLWVSLPPEDQPVGKVLVRMRLGEGKMVVPPHFSTNGFRAHIHRLEVMIGEYQSSPSRREDDRSITP